MSLLHRLQQLSPGCRYRRIDNGITLVIDVEPDTLLVDYDNPERATVAGRDQ